MSIDDIHDMLIEHMNESAASEILNAVKELLKEETDLLKFETAWETTANDSKRIVAAAEGRAVGRMSGSRLG